MKDQDAEMLSSEFAPQFQNKNSATTYHPKFRFICKVKILDSMQS